MKCYIQNVLCWYQLKFVKQLTPIRSHSIASSVPSNMRGRRVIAARSVNCSCDVPPSTLSLSFSLFLFQFCCSPSSSSTSCDSSSPPAAAAATALTGCGTHIVSLTLTRKTNYLPVPIIQLMQPLQHVNSQIQAKVRRRKHFSIH